MSGKTGNSVWLRRLSKITAAFTLILVFAGGLVTSTGSGLAVPDWPNTYGHFMFFFPLNRMVGGILYEHSHRLLASFVGLLTVVLAVWLWRVESRKWLKMVGMTAAAAVAVQGLLGGITVLFLLPTPVSVLHGVLAQSFFCFTVFIAYALSKEWRRDTSHLDGKSLPVGTLRWSVLATGAVLLQLVLGAVMRHSGSGLAIPDFPLAGGRIIPLFNQDFLFTVNQARFDLGLDPVTLPQVVIHFLHRVGAVVVTITGAGLSVSLFRELRYEKRFLLLALFLSLLLITQWILAGWVIWTAKSPWITTFHQWTGALMLGTSFFTMLRIIHLFGFSPRLALRTTWSRVSALWELTKPGITALILVSVFIGFYLAVRNAGASLSGVTWPLIHLLVGSALVSGGVGVLNEYVEREFDGRMYRTRNRPLPTGRVTPRLALTFGLFISAAGIGYLAVLVKGLTALLAALTLVLYIGLYTPLKRKTNWNTVIGAVPGAMPPLGGWAAFTGNLHPGAWILFAILFLWQIPHFFSIGRIYRRDYSRAGFKMLPVSDNEGTVTSGWIVFSCAGLLICSLFLFTAGLAGGVYLAGAALLGVMFLAVGTDAAIHRTNARARRLLLASVLYLPSLLAVLMLDRGLFG